MLVLGCPSATKIETFLRQQNSLNFSYVEVGATATSPPPGYFVSHTRAKLGVGKSAFDAAVRALQQWQQFKLGWVAPHPDNTPIRAGEAIAIAAHVAGVWHLNACRIVYTIGEEIGQQKFGFAYGTLPDHVASGEERFLVEIDEADNVWYDVLAFSLPRHPLAKISRPCLRLMQRKFARQSGESMARFVREAHRQ
jgi:uncharacterized protein (UPF0548 family)